MEELEVDLTSHLLLQLFQLFDVRLLCNQSRQLLLPLRSNSRLSSVDELTKCDKTLKEQPG